MLLSEILRIMLRSIIDIFKRDLIFSKYTLERLPINVMRFLAYKSHIVQPTTYNSFLKITCNNSWHRPQGGSRHFRRKYSESSPCVLYEISLSTC